jgi:hypothetical protein
VQTVEIDSVDGNERALDYQAYILKNIELDFSVTFNPVHHVFSPETLIEELSALDLKNKAYDIVMESKFINEFYRKKTDIQGLYAQFIGYGGDLPGWPPKIPHLWPPQNPPPEDLKNQV